MVMRTVSGVGTGFAPVGQGPIFVYQGHFPTPHSGRWISDISRKSAIKRARGKRNTDEYSRWGRVGEANKVLEERVQRSGC